MYLDCTVDNTHLSHASDHVTHSHAVLFCLAGKIKPSNSPEVFPKDRVFEVGSRITFCCIMPLGDTFDKMNLLGYDNAQMNTTKINNQTYALTVDLNIPSHYSCTDVICETTTQENGACVYIGCKYDLFSSDFLHFGILLYLIYLQNSLRTLCTLFSGVSLWTQTLLLTGILSVRPGICSQSCVTGQ